MKYRVEKRILPVEFFLNFYCMLQDINLKIGRDNPVRYFIKIVICAMLVLYEILLFIE